METNNLMIFRCERVVSALEEIDDDADQNGIAFVRIDDWDLAKSWGVHALPALLYFRLGFLLVVMGM